jgi:ATP-dependent RNA helicase DDX24/MAK5
MGKRPRNKDTQQSAAAKESVWKPVEVGLEKPGEKILDKNHYDDDEDNNNNNNTLSMAADLDVTTGEEMGMFYSLQVIEPSQYRVITGDDGTKLFQIVTADAESKNEVISDKNPAKKIASKECDEDSDKPTQTSKASETDAKVKEPPKKKQKKKSKETASSEKPDEDSALSEQETLSLQESWVIATGGVTLHQEICKGLARQQFYTPMPIQSATLPASILGRRNIVGAAPTGSGKTLSFLLPILQYLMEQKDETSTNDDEDAQEDLRKLQALILTPTRELAMQIHKECDKLVPRQIGTIVGGLALPKQARVLNKNKPPILVGTPGRLWELVRLSLSGDLAVLSKKRNH